MAVHESGVAMETTGDNDDGERMVIIGTDEIQVHPDLSASQTSGEWRSFHAFPSWLRSKQYG